MLDGACGGQRLRGRLARRAGGEQQQADEQQCCRSMRSPTVTVGQADIGVEAAVAGVSSSVAISSQAGSRLPAWRLNVQTSAVGGRFGATAG